MNLKDKLKELRNKIISSSSNNNEKKQAVDITISENNGFFKVVISDYIDILDYFETMKKIDTFKINTNVSWNSKKKRFNKGTYFIFSHNKKLYNILINQDIIKISEETKIGEESEERIIEFNKNNRDYHYFRCMHDKYCSSYLIRYYNENNPFLIDFELSDEEFNNDLNAVLSNLESLSNINEIIDINMIRKYFYDELNKEEVIK